MLKQRLDSRDKVAPCVRLQQKAAYAGHEDFGKNRFAFMHGENENFRAKMIRFNSPADLHARHKGHRVVENRYIRLRFQGSREGVLAVDGFSAYGPVRAAFDDRAKAGSHDFMVVCNQYSLHSAVPVEPLASDQQSKPDGQRTYYTENLLYGSSHAGPIPQNPEAPGMIILSDR